MTTLDKTVLILLFVTGLCAAAYGYSEVVMEPIQNITKALQAAK
jgi:hypothetical protein